MTDPRHLPMPDRVPNYSTESLLGRDCMSRVVLPPSDAKVTVIRVKDLAARQTAVEAAIDDINAPLLQDMDPGLTPPARAASQHAGQYSQSQQQPERAFWVSLSGDCGRTLIVAALAVLSLVAYIVTKQGVVLVPFAVAMAVTRGLRPARQDASSSDHGPRRWSFSRP